MLNNPLNIQERNLLKVFQKLERLAEINNVEILIDYEPKNEEDSPVLVVTVETGNEEYPYCMGFTGFGKGRKFQGCVLKQERVSYFEREGFDEEFIMGEAPIFSGIADKVEHFFGMLCIEKLDSLVFELDAG